jgi:hypothetical protein
MSQLQRFFLAVLPRSLGKAMEKESRLWTLKCPCCGHETSVWDAGGIRYLASGRPQRRFRCLTGGPQWHTLFKKELPAAV